MGQEVGHESPHSGRQYCRRGQPLSDSSPEDTGGRGEKMNERAGAAGGAEGLVSTWDTQTLRLTREVCRDPIPSWHQTPEFWAVL